MNKKIDELYDANAGRQVLGAIIQKPALLRTHQLQASDFVGTVYQTMFNAIDYITKNGANQIDPFEVDDYLKHSQVLLMNGPAAPLPGH